MKTTTTAPTDTVRQILDAEIKTTHTVCPTCGIFILAEDFICHTIDCREAMK